MTDNTCLVIALCGLPGAGKTTVAVELQERYPLRLVDRDRIRDAMFPLCAYSDAEKEASNEAVMSALVTNCRLGFDSLVDGMTFSSKAQRSEFARVVKDCGGRFAVLFLDCPLDTVRQRIASQEGGHAAADRDADLAEEVAARFEPPEGEGLRVDATGPVAEVVRQATDAVGALIEMYRKKG